VRSRLAFTLLEVCLAIFIGALIVLAAVPSLSGVLEEQRAKKVFNQFNDLVREARTHAVTERRPYALVWDKTGVFVTPIAMAEDTGTNGAASLDEEQEQQQDQAMSDDTTTDGQAQIVEPEGAKRLDFGEKETPELQLPRLRF